MKWPALLFNAAVVFICAGLLWYRLPFDAADSMTARILVVLVVAAAHALYFLLLVTPESVKAAARTYARQLIYRARRSSSEPSRPAKRPDIADLQLRVDGSGRYGV